MLTLGFTLLAGMIALNLLGGYMLTGLRRMMVQTNKAVAGVSVKPFG